MQNNFSHHIMPPTFTGLFLLVVSSVSCIESSPCVINRCDDERCDADASGDDALPETVFVKSNPFAELDSETDAAASLGDDGELPFPYSKNGDDYFSIVMLPDTQTYVRDDPEYFEAQIDWIIEHAEQLNLQLVAHVGDIVYDYDEDEAQWKTASDIMGRLDDHDIPYVTVPGNHDYKSHVRDSTMYNDWFPLSRFEGMSTYRGAFEAEADKSDSTYHLVGNESFPLLVLALEWAPRDEVVEWANGVVDDFPDHHVMVVTHAYLHEDDSLVDDDNDKRAETRLKDDDNFNEGDDIWEKLVRDNARIFMVLSGHCGSKSDPVGNRVTDNDAGLPVYQQMLNYQRFPMADNGYLKVLQFFPAESLIIVSSWSPILDQFDPRDDAQLFILNDRLFGNDSEDDEDEE